MKDNDLDFDGALKCVKIRQDNINYQKCGDPYEKEYKTIQFALALAKEIRAGTVTDEMDAQGHYDAMLAKSHIEVYKAMTVELMKKVKEDMG